VAVTRSRQNLYLSYFGNYCHPLIQSLPNIYYDKINVDDKFIESSYTSNNEEEEEVNFF
jgi:hypothetical protein